MTAIKTLNSLTLSLHIVAGFVALFDGAGAFLTKKGGLTHRRFGRAYVYSMAFVAGSALALFIYDATPTRQFLALVAVFSFYFVFSGYCGSTSAQNRTTHEVGRQQPCGMYTDFRVPSLDRRRRACVIPP